MNEITCISCGKEWIVSDIKTYIISRYNKYKITDFFCPGCDKILYGHTVVEIDKIIKPLQVRDKIKNWTNKEDRYILQWYGKKNAYEIAKDLNRTYRAVENRAGKLRKQGWPVKYMERKT